MEAFTNRIAAGQALAQLLYHRKLGLGGMVVGLPRGGIPIAYEVAKTLGARLEVWPVRKLGFPHQPELAMGAIAMGGGRYINQELVEGLSVGSQNLARVEQQEQAELERRIQLYRGSQRIPKLEGQTVILVDDGLATGATMRAALDAVSQQNPQYIIVAVPVAAPDTAKELEHLADAVVTVQRSPAFHAVGQFYLEFPQVSDQEVLEILDRSRAEAVPTQA